LEKETKSRLINRERISFVPLSNTCDQLNYNYFANDIFYQPQFVGNRLIDQSTYKDCNSNIYLIIEGIHFF